MPAPSCCPSYQRRNRSLIATLRSSPLSPAVVYGLIAALKERGEAKTDLRREASWALGELRVGSPSIEEALIHALQEEQDDPEGDVRRSAAVALGKLHPASPTTITALITAMQKGNEYEGDSEGIFQLQSRAMQSLVEIGLPAVPSVIAVLRDTKHDPDGSRRVDAVDILGRIGNSHSEAASHPALRKALIDALCDPQSTPNICHNALVALEEIGGDPAEALLPLLQDDAATTR